MFDFSTFPSDLSTYADDNSFEDDQLLREVLLFDDSFEPEIATHVTSHQTQEVYIPSRTRKEILCQHSVRKYTCKQCPGPGICAHGRQRSRCKNCSTGIQRHYATFTLVIHALISHNFTFLKVGLCPHGRQKQNCKDCGGSSFCMHSKYKSQCRQVTFAHDNQFLFIS
jgi:hypothetical protein